MSIDSLEIRPEVERLSFVNITIEAPNDCCVLKSANEEGINAAIMAVSATDR